MRFSGTPKDGPRFAIFQTTDTLTESGHQRLVQLADGCQVRSLLRQGRFRTHSSPFKWPQASRCPPRCDTQWPLLFQRLQVVLVQVDRRVRSHLAGVIPEQSGGPVAAATESAAGAELRPTTTPTDWPTRTVSDPSCLLCLRYSGIHGLSGSSKCVISANTPTTLQDGHVVRGRITQPS